MSLIFHIVSPKYDVIATSWLLSFSITSTNNKIIENYSKKKKCQQAEEWKSSRGRTNVFMFIGRRFNLY